MLRLCKDSSQGREHGTSFPCDFRLTRGMLSDQFTGHLSNPRASLMMALGLPNAPVKALQAPDRMRYQQVRDFCIEFAADATILAIVLCWLPWQL